MKTGKDSILEAEDEFILAVMDGRACEHCGREFKSSQECTDHHAQCEIERVHDT